MARDLKLAITFPSVSSSASLLTSVKNTPSGDKVDSGVAVTLALGSAGTAAPGFVSSTFNLGYKNSQMDTSSFANFIAGNEISSVTNDTPVWGNTSTAEMYLRGVFQWDFSTVTTPNVETGLFPSIVLQSAVDNGSGSPVANSWNTCSGSFPLFDAVATVSSSVAATAVINTSAPHGLVVNDVIGLSNATGATGFSAVVLYQVATAPTTTSLTIKPYGGSAIASTTGTLTATPTIFKARATGTGSAGILFSIPVVETVRPHYRMALLYPTTSTTSTIKVNFLKCGLVTGRENAPRD